MKVTSTTKAPGAIGPYSQAISANGFLYCAGQAGRVPETGKMAEGGSQGQTDQACKNVGGLLEANGLGYEDVIKTTCYLADIADFNAFNEIYAKYFTGKPARTCISAKDLPAGALCEIEVIGVLK